MAHHHDRALAGKLADEGGDSGLGFDVDVGARLVENEDLRVCEQSTCDGEALALTAGEVGSALGDRHIEAARLTHEGVDARPRERPVQALVTRMGVAHEKVFAQGSRKQVGARGHDHQMLGQALGRDVLDLDTADGNRSGIPVQPACQQCGKHYSLQEMLQWKGKGVPRCSCGGVIKPDVVLYEESLDSDVLEKAIRHIMAADLMIVGGTSLAVYPAAGLLQYYDGLDLVLINKTETPYDRRASLIIREPIGQVMSKAVQGL